MIAAGRACEEAGRRRGRKSLRALLRTSRRARCCSTTAGNTRRPNVYVGVCSIMSSVSGVCAPEPHHSGRRTTADPQQTACLRCRNFRAKASLQHIRSVEAHSPTPHDINRAWHHR